jgi:uncharacterized protein YjiK
MICVSDECYIARIDLGGCVQERLEVPDRDLEGICPSGDGTSVLVIDERERKLLRFQWNPLKLVETIDLSLRVHCIAPNRGPEGLARLNNGDIVLANESEPCSVLVLRADGSQLEYFLDVQSVSEVLLLQDSNLLLLLSRIDGVRIMSSLGKTRHRWMKLPGNSLEGLAIVAGRGLYVSNDRAPGSILVFKQFSTESSLVNELWK